MLNKSFIQFRFQQIIKFIREIPLPYLFILVLFIGFSGVVCFHWINENNNSYILTGIVLLFLLYQHLNRKDYQFINLIDEKPFRSFLVDYVLISFPFFLLEFFQQQWYAILFLLAGVISISFLPQPYPKRLQGMPVPSFIPVKAFEIRSYFRKYGLLISLLYIMAWVGLFIPYLTPGFIWLYTAYFCSSYSTGESRSVICSTEKNPQQFLRDKIQVNTLLYTCTILPLSIVYAFIYPDVWWLSFMIGISGVLSIILFIAIKYSFYKPDQPIQGGQFAGGLAIIGIILFPLQIVTLFFLFKYLWTAPENLKNYLYACD